MINFEHPTVRCHKMMHFKVPKVH